ncbi:MAG: hypothetical protein Q8K64_07250 [Sediminibacterium sp.]|nr:hypothetical protein [Sediminibacterium sp.]
MKKSIFLTTICTLVLTIAILAQEPASKTVKVIFKNGTWLPKKYTFITYSPGETGNGTTGYWFLPGFKKTITYKVGTKIYLANQPQVNVVMSGKRIDNDIPFMIVKESDNDKVISLK